MRLLPLAIALLAAGPALATHVPFVGCPADGQMGPLRPPHAHATPDLPPKAAAKLAYYEASQSGAVLAPRGWHCFGIYGSNGGSIIVAPTPLNWKRVMDDGGIVGPAIQLSGAIGGTSGRFEVAEVAARIFPAEKAFVDQVEAEKLREPFARAPYPADKITHRGPDEALFTTPAGKEGLGTQSHLKIGPLPIDGIAIFEQQDENSLTQLSARLPAAQRPLVAYIIAQVKKER